MQLNFINMLVIDAFLFYNELEILNYRLNVLNLHVDYFILVESTHTFNGVEKPLFFKENKHKFSKFLGKIIHIVISDSPYPFQVSDGSQWENEKFQREAGIQRGLANVPGCQDGDFVICSDLDEIINPRLISDVKCGKIAHEINSLEMDFYYYNLNTYVGKWSAPTLLTVRHAKTHSYRSINMNIIPNAGWHLSYFGDAEFIRNKINHFSHQELNTSEFTNFDHINESINSSSDLFKRSNVTFKRISLFNNPNLPPRMDLLVRFCGDD